MIGYVTLGTNDIDRARGFYDALLGSVGIGRLTEFGESFTLYGTAWGRPALGVKTPFNEEPATAGNGTMVALVMDERAKVDTLYNKALELGGVSEGPPGLRGDEGDQAFYGAYFRDLDGNKLCAFRVGPA